MKKSLFGIIRIRDQLAGLILLRWPGMSRSVHSSEYAALREVLIAARKDAGLTQAELANQLDRPQSFVAKYEIGERKLDVVEFVVLAQALQVEPTELFAAFIDQLTGSESVRR
jgi:hypothetical protein